MTLLTLDQAEELAARTRSAIPGCQHDKPRRDCVRCADRERVASDLAGFQQAWRYASTAAGEWRSVWEAVAADRLLGLLRTAALYGVTP